MNGSPVGFQNRTLTEPAGGTPFGRPFLTWFALVESAVAGLAALPYAQWTPKNRTNRPPPVSRFQKITP